MEKYKIETSQPLKGVVKISGSKNAVLPILAATLITEEEATIRDVPNLSDVALMKEMLEFFGGKIEWNQKEEWMKIRNCAIVPQTAPYELVGKMRASFLVMGPLLARFGQVKVPLPGGCQIGTRPVDLHLKGFQALGATIHQEHGYVEAIADKLVGSKIYLDFPSVGATENIMMAAVLAEGQTMIENCSVEPEIVDLSNFLNACGAEIRGAGTDTIRINGVKKLGCVDHTVIPDRIEAGTFMIAAAMTKGDLWIENIVMDHLKPVSAKLREINSEIEETEKGLRVFYNPSSTFKGADIKTMPYPGFPTDMQAQFMSLLSIVEGSSVVTETVFENRFMHVGELKRMGADIKIESRSAIIEGVSNLMGAKVRASDLRAGAALVLAALTADGITEISDIYHVKRGYDRFVEKLQKLGAKICLIDTE